MFEFLDKLRGLPPHKHKLIAFGMSLFLTGVVFVIWLAVLMPNFFSDQKVTEKNQQYETPSDNIWQNMAATWAGITDEYGQLKSVLASTSLTSSVEYQATSTN